MARKTKPATEWTPIVIPPAEEPADPRTPLELLIAYRWHRGEEAMAVQVYGDSFDEAKRPSVADSMVACEKIADFGPVPEGYQPPGADPEPTPLEQVIHPADPAYAPTEPRETVTAEVPVLNRYAVLGTEELSHTFILTAEERLDRAAQAERQRVHIEALKSEHAAVRKQQKEDEAAAKADHARLSTAAAEGKETRTVKVRKVADYVAGTVTLEALDGPARGATLRTSPLADDDRQLKMFQTATRAGATVTSILAELENAEPLPEDAPKEPGEDEERDDEDSDDDTDF